MIEKLFALEGRMILVTGSSRGLGFSLAEGLASSGARVILNGVDGSRLAAAVEKLRGLGYTATGECFDVTDQAAVTAAIARIEKDMGPIDVLINNAGIHRRAPLEEMRLEDWQKVIEVNLTSAFIVAQAVVQYMKLRRRGKIINITSLNAEGARPTIGNYCAAKGGLKMLTKSMAAEWGKYHITANAIGPGYFVTDLTRALAQDPKFDAWVKSEVPLARWGQPDELMGAAIFLASDASSYVNGTTIYVDGGWQASL